MARVKVDKENNSLQRIEEKCINCGACLNTCQKYNHLQKDDCINCGQCILTCPVGALVPKYNYKEVMANIHDEEKIVVISISPAVRVAIGDDFGYAPGEFLEGKLVGVLKTLGFDYVFDTTFGADLTIMEEASELVKRLETKQNLPMFTSCCPSWVLYMEKYHPNYLNHLSTCQSPIGMQGSMIKNYVAQSKNLNAKDIVTVALAPCVSKKSEIKKDGKQNTDYVLTTSELVLMIREAGLDFESIKEQKFDSLMGSGAGLIFGTSGGVMEAALRTTYYLINKKTAPEDFFNLTIIRGNKMQKEATIDLGPHKIKVAVLFGNYNVEKMFASLKEYQFVEVMTCPNGCVGGSGQPILPVQKQNNYIEERSKSLYEGDSHLKWRSSYENLEIQKLYKEYLQNPLSKKAHELLHTTYEDRSEELTVKN